MRTHVLVRRAERADGRRLVEEYYIDALVKVRAVESGTVSFGSIQAGSAPRALPTWRGGGGRPTPAMFMAC